MGTVLFIIFRLSGLIDTKNDWVILCYLVAIDSIGIPNILKLAQRR